MKNIILVVIFMILLTGCATTGTQTIGTTSLPTPYQKGIYHTVARGETLWRIAKAYNADLKRIIDTNNLSDPSHIDVDQKVFIPGAKTKITTNYSTSSISLKSKKGYIWPLKGKVITYFGSKTDGVTSKGIEIAKELGVIVVASRAGHVVFCDDKVKGLGRVVIIDHNNGYSSVYAYNSENLVECGDHVKQNQPIAKVGDSGRAKHSSLHFQIRRGHEPQDPFYYLP